MCIQNYPRPNVYLSSTKSKSENNVNAISSSTMKTRKSVSFNEEVAVQRVLHIDNYTNQEMKDCWFGPTDYKKIRDDCITTLKLIKLNKNFTGCCTRGLEQWMDGNNKTRKRRQISVLAVMDEQYSQCLQAEKKQEISYLIYDDVKIREVYRRHTDIAVDIAYSMGRIDEIRLTALGSGNKKSNRKKKSPTVKTTDTNKRNPFQRRLRFIRRQAQVSPIVTMRMAAR